jgi:tetratricopeptide (TPR) repeat protein
MALSGRNDPCPCGSGLKYKKCCLAREISPNQEPDSTEQIRSTAFKEMSLENWNQAIDLFNSILDNARDPHILLEAMASCYDGLEEYLIAAEYYEKALAVAPESRFFDLHYMLGISRACGGRPQKGAEAFRQCLEMTQDPKQKQHLTQILQALEEIQAGSREKHTFVVNVLLQRAFSDMEADKYDFAAQKLERTQRIEPDNPVISYNLGVAYTFLKREEEALAQFQKTIDINPAYVQAWYNMGQICMIKKRDFSKALHCFDRATAVRPDYVSAHHQKGIVLELMGDIQKAMECWKRTLELDPDNKQALDNIKRLGLSDSAETKAQ